MPRTQLVKDYNTFIKGIITEANALTFPENASIDEENFVLNTDGSRQRRLGMDYEEGYATLATLTSSFWQDSLITVHKWDNADNSGLYSFAVVQVSNLVYFYDLKSDALSQNRHSFTFSLATYLSPWVSSGNVASAPIHTAVGKGALFISSKNTEPFYIEYDSVTDTFSITEYTLEQRDFTGIDDGLDVTFRPLALGINHQYNLDNQGWGANQYEAYNTSKNVYPSNADIWILAKDANDDFSPNLLDKQFFGNTRAPTGHNIIGVFNKDRTAVNTLLPIQYEKGRPEAVSFYAGRVFYAGIESNTTDGISTNGNIYFSQILTDLSKAGKCYQEADPTSEEISDLLEDDGGVITIPEIGKVLKLEVLYDSLVILADNGVWQIKGDADAGFNALAYQVQKVTTIGPLNEEVVVVAENSLIYWADSGIYSLSSSEVTGLLQSQNISETTIQTLYRSIPSIGKKYAKGIYDLTANKVIWLYNDDPSYDGVTFRSKFNKELVLDIVLGSFYKNSIGELSADSPYVAGVVSTPDLLVSDIVYNIEVSGVQVQASGVDVQASLPSNILGEASVKYFTAVPGPVSYGSTWSLYNNTDFIDWEKKDTVGVDSEAFLLAGYETFGDVSRTKSTPYIITHFQRTETGFVDNGSGIEAVRPSGCLMQARWGWSDSSTSGRWSSEQQVYRLNRNYIPVSAGDPFDYGFSVITTKNKVRGSGEALSINFRSQPGKDMHLLGWTSSVLGESTI